MLRVIKLTLLTDISSCIVMIIVLTIADSFSTGLYVGLLTFGNLLLPTLGSVAIYLLIKKRTSLSNPTTTTILQIILLTGLLMLALFVWTAGEAAITKTFTWADIKAVYDSQFAGYLPVLFSEAILIPVFDLFIKRSKPK